MKLSNKEFEIVSDLIDYMQDKKWILKIKLLRWLNSKAVLFFSHTGWKTKYLWGNFEKYDFCKGWNAEKIKIIFGEMTKMKKLYLHKRTKKG